MLENHCTHTVQSSHGGCSQRVHKIGYIAVKKGKYFTSVNIQPELLSLIIPAVYLPNNFLCGLSDTHYSTRGMPKK